MSYLTASFVSDSNILLKDTIEKLKKIRDESNTSTYGDHIKGTYHDYIRLMLKKRHYSLQLLQYGVA